MDAVLRKLKLKKSEPRESEARKKLQQELFSVDKARHKKNRHFCLFDRLSWQVD